MNTDANTSAYSRRLSRRSLLAGAAVAGALAVAACSPTQVAQFQADWSTVAGDIQEAVAQAAKYVPTVESIAATAASLFGPTYEAIVVAGSAALNSVVSALTAAAGALNPSPSTASLRRLRETAASGAVPTVIGTTPQGVQVVGWK